MKTAVTKNRRDPDAPRPFKRQGLHRLSCPMCDGYAYATLANLETMLARHGRLPGCACGATLEPDRLELADALGMPHALLSEFGARLDRKLQGQRPHAYRGHKTVDATELAGRAFDELLAIEHEKARARQAGALNRGKTTAASRAADLASIPF